MNYSQMLEFEEDFRKEYLLDPEELKFLMDDLRGEPLELHEMVQVLLDGGIEPEYLGEKYKTSMGYKNLIMVIACQDHLEVDFNDLSARIDRYYTDLEIALKEEVTNLLEEQEGGATVALSETPSGSSDVSGAESEDSVTEVFVPSLDENGVPLTTKDRKGKLVVQFSGEHSDVFGLVGREVKWNADHSVNSIYHSTDQVWSGRVMHAGWLTAVHHLLFANKWRSGSGPPGQFRPGDPARRGRSGFTPKQWLGVVRASFGMPNEGTRSVPEYLRSLPAEMFRQIFPEGEDTANSD